MITAIIMFILALIFLIISALQFAQKGICFNNAYLWADEEERQRTDYGPHYRQSAIAFLIAPVMFVALGLYCLFFKPWQIIAVQVLAAVLLIYVIVSEVRIRRK